MAPFTDREIGLDALIHRFPPGPWDRFLRQPCLFLARKLYAWRPRSAPLSESLPVTVVCVSDTHNSQPALPDGDVLVHAGDLTQSGTYEELCAALGWLSGQPHPVKIVVAGNHDILLDAKHDAIGNRAVSTTDPSKSPEALRAALPWGDVIYLQNEGITVTCPNGRRLRVYGSPNSARYGNWAFQYPKPEDVWSNTVPDGTDILVTHGPPRGHRDLNLGCIHLSRELWRVRPRLHVFGHIHEGAGMECVGVDALQGAYEGTVVDGGGFWNLVWTVVRFLQAWVLVLGGLGAGKGKGRGEWCTLVNAAVVGGLRDVQARGPVTVVI